jgi:hypothetical protein
MVDILIHKFQSGGGAVDAAAFEEFQQQWATYQKIVDGDALSHKESWRLLHDTLKETFATPFAFLDVACGDASETPNALPGAKVRHYRGIDLSEPALSRPLQERQSAGLDHADS